MEEVWGSNPHSSTLVTSQDIEDTPNPYRVRGVFGFGPGGRLPGRWTISDGLSDRVAAAQQELADVLLLFHQPMRVGDLFQRR